MPCSEQATAHNFVGNYTIYDNLNRIIEVGEIGSSTQMTDSIAHDQTILDGWIASGTRTEVIHTYYEQPIVTLSFFTQSNLRNRIALITFEEIYDGYDTTYHTATHYSYDILGNVNSLLQENKSLESFGRSFKRIDYVYELASGKVTRVCYECDSIDQFIHEYEYDADNRLISVRTSTDNIAWEYDADYVYYDHGPLSRTILGANRVQGLDYAYTLQGWLKGINTSTATDSIPSVFDMGLDGTGNGSVNPIARDAFGYTIGYFDQDYLAIGTSQPRFEAAYENTALGDSSYYLSGSGNTRGLYNGNIRHTVYSNEVLDSMTIGYKYEYDQLNRLVGMKAFSDFDPDNNQWGSTDPIPDFQENVEYDPNGNILSYLRNATSRSGRPLAMDSLYYQYITGTNKLSYVRDSVDAGNYAVDIDDQVSANYKYDPIGNMIADTSEGLVIYWNTYNKVDSIYNWSDGTALKFIYDPMNNRVEKRYYVNAYPSSTARDTVITYYIRDAMGNVLSMYQKDQNDSIFWNEVNLYGSSRIGQLKPDTVVYYPGYALTGAPISNIMAGNKIFEITNHLGNVMAVISDQTLPVDTNGGGADYYEPIVIQAQDYYPFGMVMPGRNYNAGDYRFGFNGQEKDDEIKGSGNSYDLLFRIYDPRLGKFLSVDPLEREYPWNSPYAFAENRVIDGRDLEGKEWENFMAGFKKPGELKIKLPNEQSAQKQHYSVTIQNPNKSFADFKKEFKKAPQDLLTNSKAEFNAPVDKEGKPSQFKEGSYIKIDIAGPMNNSYVMVKTIQEAKDGSLSATFVTMEGHVEKGIITFKLSQDDKGNIKFDINSTSEVDFGSVPDFFARDQQAESWKEVLNNVVNKTGGTEVDRKVEVTEPAKSED